MDRFEEIERLGALRDKGLLTEAEFQEQKARALGSGPPKAEEAGAVDAPPPETGSPAPPASGPPLLTIGLGALALVAIVALVAVGLGRRAPPAASQAPAVSPAPSAAAPAQPPYDVNGVMPKAELTAAWNVLPGSARAEGAPDYLYESGGQYALVYSASEGDSHAAGESFSVAALSKDDAGYHLIKLYPEVTKSGSFGSAEAKPIGFGDGSRYLRVMGGFTGQGCTVANSTILRVAPGKPVEALDLVTAVDNTSSSFKDKSIAIEGKLYPGPRSLTVRYAGVTGDGPAAQKVDRTLNYAIKDGRFVLTTPGFDPGGC